VALTLFPLAFITLFAWATAGSTTDNTTDPVRSAVWFFLGAHLIPFATPTGKLTALPLLAVLAPLWAIRRGFPTVQEAFSKINGARIVYALWYSLFVGALALASRYHGVEANWYLAPIFGLVIALVATSSPDALRNRGFYFTGYLFLIALGMGSILFAISLAGHWSIVKSIAIVISPGAVGGTIFTALQLLYLPNMALATLSYFTGSGFSFGAHSVVNAHQVILGQIPAIPVLAALPTGIHKDLVYGRALWPLFFLLVFLLIRRESLSFFRSSKYAVEQGVRFFIVLGALAYLSAGELLTSALNPVGVIWWKFLEYLGVAFFAAYIVVLFLPSLFRREKNLV
jgi:hypothetical protein